MGVSAGWSEVIVTYFVRLDSGSFPEKVDQELLRWLNRSGVRGETGACGALTMYHCVPAVL